MSMSNYLLMPLSKQAFQDADKTRQAIDLLVSEGLVSLDSPTQVWSYPYLGEDEGYGEERLSYSTLRDLRQALDSLNLQEINFEIGFSRYSTEYDEFKDRLPGINALTDQLQHHMFDFCEAHDISPVLDVYGSVTLGFLAADGEDGLGEVRGLGVFCDGSSAYFMEEAGYLEAAQDAAISKLFSRIAAIYGEEMRLQFRG